MSVPRVLLAPTHRTGLANAIASALAEVVGRQERHVRFHHLGALGPTAAWDRWEGSSFLDPSLYDMPTLRGLYELSTRGADLSLLACDAGLLDGRSESRWTPLAVARALDAPVLLVLDCTGWGVGITALVSGFNERSREGNLVGVILTGVADGAHREALRAALAGTGLPVVGCLYQSGEIGWSSPSPGAGALPLPDELIGRVFQQIDLPGVERFAGQRGFLPAASAPRGDPPPGGPLVLVAGGRGFTPWSRDSIELLRGTGLTIRRLDLLEDEGMPPQTAGLVLAGHLWTEALPDLTQNYPLMRDIRLHIAEGMPMLALGGGALYLLRRLRDVRGRTFDMTGLLPGEGEVLEEREQPLYLQVRAERDSLLCSAGQTATGWLLTDAEFIDSPVSRSFAFSLRPLGEEAAGRSPGSADGPEAAARGQLEGAAARNLLCSRVLLHLASIPGAAARFATAVRAYSAGAVGSR